MTGAERPVTDGERVDLGAKVFAGRAWDRRRGARIAHTLRVERHTDVLDLGDELAVEEILDV